MFFSANVFYAKREIMVCCVRLKKNLMETEQTGDKKKSQA